MGEISKRAAKVMRELREERGISQEFIATTIGVTRQAYSRYENGQREPGLDIINKICEVYSFSPVLLFFSDYKEIDSAHIKLTGTLAKYEESLRLILSKYREIKRNTIYANGNSDYMVHDEEVYKDNEKTLILKNEIIELNKDLPQIKKAYELYLLELESAVHERVDIINDKFIDNHTIKKEEIPFDFY
ncbi:MAG: helix-turn-helix domain-containing protein [Candidatus Izemoplasmatales bacterium]